MTRPPPWAVGLGFLPLGVTLGSVITIMPFVLANDGVTADRIAALSALALSPMFWGVMFAPLIDATWNRRAYVAVGGAVTAIGLASAGVNLSAQHLTLLTASLVIAVFGCSIYVSAASGWMSEFVTKDDRASVGAWTNIANVGAGVATATAILGLRAHISLIDRSAMLAVLTLLGMLPLLSWPAPAPREGRPPLRSLIGVIPRALAMAPTRRGLLLFLSPAGAMAGITLFAGLGTDFGVSPDKVVWLTGLGAAIATTVGAGCGGIMAGRLDHRYVYLAAGAGAAACMFAMAIGSRSDVWFIGGVLSYNFMAGAVMAAFTAHGLELVGNRSPAASTQLAVFVAAMNGSTAYMTWLDGLGYRLNGLDGLLMMDGGVALLSCAVLLAWYQRPLRASAAEVTRDLPVATSD